MIEIGEYARNESGIYKIIGKYERRYSYDLCVQLGNFYTGEFEGEQYESRLKIGKLIDLIEVGDLVNGMIVFDIITYDNGEKAIKLSSGYLMNEKEIKDILTHEQYQANCYTVERNEE